MYNIPDFLYKKLSEQYGKDIADKIINGYSKKRKTTIRVNTIKSNVEYVKEKLKENNISYKNVDWYNDAIVVENNKENEIRNLEIYKEGYIYMQSLSSMIPPIVLSPKQEENILDMAAAPGGKTTQIASLTNNNSYITACEKNKIRVERLKYNIEKQDAKGINVLLADARKLDDYLSFDKILLDAPCSGSGTIYLEDNNLLKNFTEELVERSVKVQYELLKKAANILKIGGEMVYSTCSILQDENEDNILKIIKDNKLEVVPIDESFSKKLSVLPSKIKGTLCVCPNELYEGFYIAKLKRIR